MSDEKFVAYYRGFVDQEAGNGPDPIGQFNVVVPVVSPELDAEFLPSHQQPLDGFQGRRLGGAGRSGAEGSGATAEAVPLSARPTTKQAISRFFSSPHNDLASARVAILPVRRR